MERTVLVIDDDAKLQALLSEFLQGYGMVVTSLPDGNNACEKISEVAPDIVILDVMMPGKDGIDVLRDIRRESRVPVIMLTAKGEDSDRIVGLELGADDYVPKPFNPRELLARMKAVLRRVEETPEQVEACVGMIEAGGLKLDLSRSVLVVGDDEVILASTECRLLEVFMRHPDRALSRDQLMDKVWGKAFEAYDRSIDVHVSKLRAELKPYAEHADRIMTVWGTGYRFRSDG
ncbi:response regulator [Desulfovibrio ferrophilus]|nr:response regulator transcription factor [Desulfovibrio ferrophilus]